MVKLLLERGAAVNIPGRGGLTPLHEAAGCGQVCAGAGRWIDDGRFLILRCLCARASICLSRGWVGGQMLTTTKTAERVRVFCLRFSGKFFPGALTLCAAERKRTSFSVFAENHGTTSTYVRAHQRRGCSRPVPPPYQNGREALGPHVSLLPYFLVYGVSCTRTPREWNC